MLHTCLGRDYHRRVLDHPSAMVRRPGLLLRLLSFFVYRHVTVEDADVQRLRDIADDGSVIYVARSRSLLDYLFFNWLLLRQGLALCRFAVGVVTTAFRPVTEVVRRRRRRRDGEQVPSDVAALEQALVDDTPGFLFLERRTGWRGRRQALSEDYVRRLLLLQEGRERPILLVPLLVLWRPRPQRLKPSLVDVALGAEASPGRLRKLWTVLLSGRRAQVYVGTPVDLRALGEAREEEPADRLARKVRGALYVHLTRRTRVAIGPRVKARERLLGEVRRSLENRGDLEPLARETGKPSATLQTRAGKLLDEIAADFQLGMIRFLHWALHFVWNRIYDGLEADEAGLQRVVEAAEKTPVVLVPSHKSHVDYLIISWLFHDRGMLPPHIAAGANMNFFPMGPLFRRAGAFFLRRTFKGDPLYPVVFAAYMRKLLREGYNLEFFIEGGRSRSGKILPPKLGLLSYIVDAVLEGGTRDVHFVPVAVGYERVVEAAAYEREHSGGKKSAEDLSGLLRAGRVLTRRHGRLYVEFDEPLSLREWLAAHAGGEDGPPEEERPAAVARLGHHLAWRLACNTTVMPISLVATALLCHPRRGLNRRDLLLKVGFLQGWAAAAGARFSGSIRLHIDAAQVRIAAAGRDLLPEASAVLGRTTSPERAPAAAARGEALGALVDAAASLFTGDKTLTVLDYDDGEVVYRVAWEHRIRLDYYRNNLIPLLISEAIVATAILACPDEPRQAASRLSRLLKREFLFQVDASFDDLFDAAAGRLEAMALVERSGEEQPRATEGAEEALGFLREMLRPFLEAYLATARCLLAAADSTERAPVLATAERLYHQGELSVPEACSGVVLKNAERVLGALEPDALMDAEQELERLRGGPLGG